MAFASIQSFLKGLSKRAIQSFLKGVVIQNMWIVYIERIFNDQIFFDSKWATDKEGIVAHNRLDWEKLFNKLPRCLLLKRPTWTTLIESSVHIFTICAKGSCKIRWKHQLSKLINLVDQCFVVFCKVQGGEGGAFLDLCCTCFFLRNGFPPFL